MGSVCGETYAEDWAWARRCRGPDLSISVGWVAVCCEGGAPRRGATVPDPRGARLPRDAPPDPPFRGTAADPAEDAADQGADACQGADGLLQHGARVSEIIRLCTSDVRRRVLVRVDRGCRHLNPSCSRPPGRARVRRVTAAPSRLSPAPEDSLIEREPGLSDASGFPGRRHPHAHRRDVC